MEKLTLYNDHTRIVLEKKLGQVFKKPYDYKTKMTKQNGSDMSELPFSAAGRNAVLDISKSNFRSTRVAEQFPAY